ncbi:hypothetical protein F5877DRAFT_93625 [Lentinula edodes]|nr:hypothetical protein F5877DRAFT_93625 [Lentinula edodes]
MFEHGPDNVGSDDDLSDGERSESSDAERPDVEDGDEFSIRGSDAFNPYSGLTNKRQRTDLAEKSPEWFPWPNRTACTLDILMHLPRSVFSVRQLDLFLWLLRVNGIEDATSVKTMKDLDTKLQKLYGIQTYKYKGAFGHLYYVNSLADIISQEMCNPQVRNHLSFYPEDRGAENLSEARQFARWLHEIPDDELGPMVRLGPSSRSHDYYIFEPAMLRSGIMCMPHRWFKRQEKFYARCWRLEETVHPDASKGWKVIKGDGEFIVNEDEFLLCFTQLVEGKQELYGSITDVTKIEAPPTWTDWTLTNPAVGNEWRKKADGAECLSFPIWLYCDDTSGNTSKRWNAHNSFLFTAAGLPRSEASKEYNVHFLATSNSAPTLEMLDGIADQLHDCQENGIWAWDSKTQSRVLLLVCVLALLGDNPMQSEFACHIGLRGKFFCRTCWVKGKDAKAENVAVPEERDTSSGDDESDTQSVDSASTSASKGGKRKKRKVFKESLQSMYNRVKSFVKPGKPRTKDETIAALKSQFVHAESVGTAKKLEEMRTASGIKDTYQMFFINRLLKRRQNQSNELHLVSENLMSPVWRIRGLDPHSDTPVEILHVVLLGFVKYLWRDVIDNQLKKNADKKKELATRLSSLDISGLGIESKLAGNTLVNHYGSLTGSDFRKISQVAPFVLKGFVSDECYQTWLSLSKLIPLIWQPEIKSLDSYIALLQHEIEQFLLYAAKWSIRWFNKPKFHILVHLPDHIRRFGPAILFATEVFESYNAVIRAKTPSRDIAWAFAKQNRIRHMLSGGQFLDGEQIDLNPSSKAVEDTTLPQKDRLTRVQRYFRNGSVAQQHWVQVGQSALDVVSWSGVIKKSLGVVDHVVGGLPLTGSCVLDASSSSQKWVNTAVGRLAAETSLYSPQEKAECSFHRAKFFLSTNGDKCSPLDFVACSAPAVNVFGVDGISVVRIKEALGCKRNIFPIKTVDCVLVEAFHVSTVASGQGMPRLSPSRQVFTVPPASIHCCLNVQHDCIQNKCQIEGKAPVHQEREKTSELTDIVVHKGVLEDWVLNTAQMRDAQYLQRTPENMHKNLCDFHQYLSLMPNNRCLLPWNVCTSFKPLI